MSVVPETPEPYSPGWGRWALKNKAQPPSPLPPTFAAPWRTRPLRLRWEPVFPLAPAPGPRPSQPTPPPHQLQQPPPMAAAFGAESPRRGFPF